ncbi:restriction endonuclease subunit S [Halomonas sp. SIMBA_159]
MSLGHIGEPLPKEWSTPLLSELTTPKQWKTISTKALLSEGYTVYGANGKIGYFDQYTHEHPTIMITCRGATCGNLHISEPFSYINGNAMALDGQPTTLVGLKFLYFALKARGLEDTISGSAQPQITGKGLSEVRLPLPPLAEQKVIADKLDTLLAQVENTKARLERIPQVLKRFRQSVLAAAVSGRLTEEWREDSTYNDEGYPDSWTFKHLSEVGQLARGKSKHRPRNDPRLFGEEYPFIQTGEVANATGEITSATRFYSVFGLEQSRLFPAGTLCITIAANIADTAILGIDACFPDSVVGFTPKDSEALAYFVKYLIDVNKQDLESFAPATAQKNINLKVLNELRLPFPSLEEQTEIVRRVDQLFAHADRIEQQVNNALARVNNLTQSILAKAFRGELTEQWRRDNPALISGENSAQALLERIKAERAAMKPAKKTRQKRTTA